MDYSEIVAWTYELKIRVSETLQGKDRLSNKTEIRCYIYKPTRKNVYL